MAWKRNIGVLLAGSLLLAGCETSLWPSLTGEEPRAQPPTAVERVEIAPSPEERVAAAATPSPAAASVSQAETVQLRRESAPAEQPTGTFVGKKVEGLRAEHGKLNAAVDRLSGRMLQIRGENTDATQRYLSIVAGINAKLQPGTTPGNPILVQQWNEAQRQLERVERNLTQMNQLSNDIAAEASMASYLLDNSERPSR